MRADVVSKRSRGLRTGALAAGGALALVAAAVLWPTVAEPAAAGTATAQPSQRRPTTTTTTAPALDASRPAAREPADQPAGLLRTTSARIEDRTVDAKPTPVALRIESLSVVAPITPAGALPNGEMEVPDGIDDVAWFAYGPSPGQPGSAVLAAHVDLAGQGPGVFFRLTSLERGDRIAVDFADRATQVFEVVDAATYDKHDLDRDRIFARNGSPVLTLITCGGGFNPSIRRYDSNVVVYAVPVIETAKDPS
jgi:hypothetical protein